MQGLRAEGRAPRMIVIENVCGLLTSHGGKDFDAICDALADAGYRFGAVVIDAALFVPQSRERVFIIAVDADAHIPAELLADGPTAPFHPPALVAACQRQRDPHLVAPSSPAEAKHDARRHHRGRADGRPLAYASRDRSIDRDDDSGPSRENRGREARRQADGRRPLPAHPR